ncbi:Uncharacterised protein [Serratia fonticola]|nr:Uncharacterised protein [Serratia fonticola]CAI0987739.1 Uncharacterised protein [Serratia fonticola]
MMKRAQHAAPLQGKTRDNVFVVASMFDRRGAACCARSPNQLTQ